MVTNNVSLRRSKMATVAKMAVAFALQSSVALAQSPAPQQAPAMQGQQIPNQTQEEISPLGRISPDFIQMGNGERKALDIEAIAKLNEEISRKEFESKLRELYKIEDKQLGVPPPLPEVPVMPVVVEKVEEPVVVEKKLVAFVFDSVFGTHENLRAEVRRSDGVVFSVKAGAKNNEFVVHDLTNRTIDLQFCKKGETKSCKGDRFTMKLGQMVVFEEIQE